MEKSIDPIPIDLAESDGERVQDSHPVKASTKKSSKKISNLTNLTKPGSHFKRQRRLTSEVWVNYEFLDEPDENGNLLCKCKKCGTTYNADSKNGTGNLKRHIQNCKRRNYLDFAIVPSTSHSHTSNNKSGQHGVVDVDPVCDEFMTDFDSFSSEKSTVHLKSDLAMYLEEPLVPRTTNIDILYHWKTNSGRFPILCLMAKDVLAIPISTVASESAFSTGGRVLDCYRSSLKPSTVEAVICLKDWTLVKVDNTDTPSPPESASPSPAESAMENNRNSGI
ncbi:Zinc finger BED domain-containing protein RICESLEEPER 2 [Bienertia sinuspersici]